MENTKYNTRQILYSKPIIKKEMIVYERSEKFGMKSISFLSEKNNKPIVFSNFDVDIISCCNGDLTVLEIVEKISGLYCNIPWLVNLYNANQLFSFLTDLGVLRDYNYNCEMKNIVLNNGIRIDFLSDMNCEGLKDLLEQVYKNESDYYLYANPKKQSFSPLQYIVHSLKNSHYKFFTISEWNVMLGLLSVKEIKYQKGMVLEGFISKKNTNIEINIEENNFCDFIFEGNSQMTIFTTTFNEPILDIFISGSKDTYVHEMESLNKTEIIETCLYKKILEERKILK